MGDLRFAYGTVDKIVCIQGLEHLSIMRGLSALGHWWLLLKPGGVLIVAVPDMDGTINLLEQGHVDFARRHLRGSRRDEFNYHQTWYTPATLCEILETIGYRVTPLENFHVYPAIVMRAVKRDPALAVPMERMESLWSRSLL